ncbi:MAG: peptide-methionine (S)-S-oxide reductase MsrA [Candidatus Micrarchaeota archaeon]|nr:peptide-methionine (S)-S-oxide reductase MsrA [Candidatus Micrarchaeota archaeon]
MSERIVLGGGCFWCTEAALEIIKGVIRTAPGYAGGRTKNPTYEQVCEGDTGHAEVLEVEYDPKVVSLEKLLDVFFTMHDPTSLNKQGADIGTQYRSIILYTKSEQKEAVTNFIQNLQKEYSKPIVTEVKMLDAFYPAEEYHKDYFKKNPDSGYCAFVIRPKVEKVRKKFGIDKSKL